MISNYHSNVRASDIRGGAHDAAHWHRYGGRIATPDESCDEFTNLQLSASVDPHIDGDAALTFRARFLHFL
jgi:hypothetical protein